MKCWFCRQGLTNRCVEGAAFGTQLLAGGQAEFARVPFADGTLQPIPAGLDERVLIMMSDIFPTGYYATCRAIEGLEGQFRSRLTSMNGIVAHAGHKVLANGNGLTNGVVTNGVTATRTLADAVMVCLGCGPVGICAIATARSMGVKTIFAVDSVDDRLREAADCGAIALNLTRDNVLERVKAASSGRGADAVVELVGNKPALKSAFDLLRPCGILSSVGFHQSDLPFTGLDCYLKSIT